MSLFGGELKLWSAYSSCLLFTINYKIWCENDSYSFWNGSGRWAQLAVTTCLQHNPSGRHRPETHLFVQPLLWPITQDTLKEGGRFSLESCELSLLQLTIGSSLPVTARLSWDFRASETWFQKGLNYRTLMSISVWIVFQNVARHLPLPVSGKTSTCCEVDSPSCLEGFLHCWGDPPDQVCAICTPLHVSSGRRLENTITPLGLNLFG